MLNGIIEFVIETGLQAIGWGVLKLISLGRYRGFQQEDALFEGAVGLGTLLAAGYAVYWWWP
jgi:hypothetical protein